MAPSASALALACAGLAAAATAAAASAAAAPAAAARAVAASAAAAAPSASLLGALASVGLVAAASAAASASDWRAFRARGALNLAVAYALAAAFLLGAPALFARAWPALRPLDAGVGGARSCALFVAAGFACNSLTSLLGNVLFLPLYWTAPAWADKYRTGVASWPWRSPSEETRRRFWNELLPSSLVRVAVNHALVLPLLVATWTVLPLAHRRQVFAAELPDAATLCWQLVACTAVEDALFYLGHRALHTPWLYKHVHSVHHEWHVTTTLTAEHAHVLEFVLSNMGPAVAGPLLFRVHALTLWMFIVMRVCVSFEEHAGYAFPWSPCRLLPCGATVAGHDYHHANNGDGIFASEFHVLDAVLGTNGSFEAVRDARAARVAKVGAGGSGDGEGAITGAPASAQ